MERSQVIALLKEAKDKGIFLEQTGVFQVFGDDVFPRYYGRALTQLIGSTYDENTQIMERLGDIHTETSLNERRFLYSFFRNIWDGATDVLEVGPFLGGTSRAIAMGMLKNQGLKPGVKLYTYDRFDNYYSADQLLGCLAPMFQRGILDASVANVIRQSTSFLEVFNLVHGGTDYGHLIEAARGTLPSEAASSTQQGALASSSTPMSYLRCLRTAIIR